MGVIASLDMGSEKMVMALATAEGNNRRLTGIKIMASQGMKQGLIEDEEKVRACIRSLMSELLKDRPVEIMHVALTGKALRMVERKITVALQKKGVEQNDLCRAEQCCMENYKGGKEELVDMISVGYAVDGGELVADPLGMQGRKLEVTFQVYLADEGYLSRLRQLFEGAGVGEVVFYPVVRAYAEAVDAEGTEGDFALVDLGAESMKVVLFRDHMLEYEAYLPLGTHTIDTDIMAAFALSAGQARKLKHEFGQALRSACKNKKLPIPDTRLTLESRDLATVVQSRAEELLEGVVYRLQSWGFDRPEDRILLTGGGSRLADVDELLHRMTGQQVGRAVARRIQVSRDEVLRAPEYLVALGLLLCSQEVEEEMKPTILGKLKGLFGM